MSDYAIIVKGVSKDFKFSASRGNTLKSLFTGVFTHKDSSEKTQHALKNVSFEIKKGEFFGIVGRNGSGKSTLLKILAGIYQPTKGSVSVDGRIVPFIELGVGFNPELTGRENVYMNGAMLGFSEAEVSDFYDEVVEFAELDKFMDKKLKNYSSGMQVRLAFSMAIRANAEVLIVDEVLAVGDSDFQRKCFNYFMQLKASDVTVVFVTHDMNAIRRFCDRAMLIDDCKVVSIGDIEDVAQGYSKLFLEEGPSVSESGPSHDGSSGIFDINVSVGGDVELNISITPDKRLNNPIFGFTIKDASGTPILGTNSILINRDLGMLEKGERYLYTWSFANILSDGTYTVDLALLEEDSVSVVEWLDSATEFSVKKIISSPYPIMPEIKLKEGA